MPFSQDFATKYIWRHRYVSEHSVRVRVVEHGAEGVQAQAQALPLVRYDGKAVGLDLAEERADIGSVDVIEW